MIEKKVVTSFFIADIDDLSSIEQSLVEKAIIALDSSYATYSGFSVGASILFDDGTTIEGSNQENVAYPSGLCAERVALFYAGSKYPDKIIKTNSSFQSDCLASNNLPAYSASPVAILEACLYCASAIIIFVS